MPRTTTRYTHTFTEVTVRRMMDLAEWWGGIAALPDSQVIREAIDRAWEAESKGRKRNGKKTSRIPTQGID